MQRLLPMLTLPVIFSVACSSNSLPANKAPAVAQTGATSPLPAENQDTFVYEAPPVVSPPSLTLTNVMPIMPVPACGLPAPLSPVTISCNLPVPPPEPPPTITCAEPPYSSHPDTDTGSVE